MRPKILYSLFSNIISIKGIGPKYAKLIERLCGKYLIDLIFHKPAAYIDRRSSPKISELKNDTIATLIVNIDSHTPSFNKRMPYRINCSDESGQMSIVYFNMRGPYIKKILPVGSKRVISGKIEMYKDTFQMTHPHHIADVNDLNKIKAIECIYPLTAGLTSRSIQKAINSSLEISNELPEWIPEHIMKENDWITWSKSVNKLHNPDKIYENHSSPHLERLVFDELLSHQLTIRPVSYTHLTLPTILLV